MSIIWRIKVHLFYFLLNWTVYLKWLTIFGYTGQIINIIVQKQV